MYIPPEQYATTPAYDLLEAASAGFIGFDQRLVNALVDDPGRTLADIIRFAQNELDPDLTTDLGAILHHLNTPLAAPFYVEAIRRYAEEVPDEITAAVVALGAAMLEPLLALYAELPEEHGADVAFMLAGLGVRDPRILDLLLERLEYEAGDGALSLSAYGDPAAIPHIERILAEVPESDPNLRHELKSAIEQIEASPDPASPPPPEPFDAFDQFPEQLGPHYALLTQEQRLTLLDATPPEIRADAAATFRNEEVSRPIRDRLSQLAKLDPDPNVRGRAWESLANDAGEPEIRRSMFEAARTGPLEERTGAIVALASSSEPGEELFPLIQELYDNEPTARAKAVEAMWKTLDPRYRQYMVRHLDDPDADVRHHAIYGIGYLNAGSEAPRLIPLFEDEDFRHDALLAYSLAVPTDVSRGRMKPLLRRIEQLAGGLTEAEEELVKDALDQRLSLHGHNPVFGAAEPEGQTDTVHKVGRNDPCPCGSGKKYKKCHGT